MLSLLFIRSATETLKFCISAALIVKIVCGYARLRDFRFSSSNRHAMVVSYFASLSSRAGRKGVLDNRKGVLDKM
jgi:hypothetical protein